MDLALPLPASARFSALLHLDAPLGPLAFVDESRGSPFQDYRHGAAQSGGHVFTPSTLGAASGPSMRSPGHPGKVRFPGAAARFTGAAGQYIDTPDSPDWDLSSGDATVHYWIFLEALAAFSAVMGQNRATADGQWFHYYYADGRVAVGVSGVNEIATAAGVMTAGALHHVAITMSGTTVRIFVDGVQQASATTAVFNNSANSFRVGANNPAENAPNGWMQELAIIKGYARWTASFAAALPQVRETVVKDLEWRAALAAGLRA